MGYELARGIIEVESPLRQGFATGSDFPSLIAPHGIVEGRLHCGGHDINRAGLEVEIDGVMAEDQEIY